MMVDRKFKIKIDTDEEELYQISYSELNSKYYQYLYWNVLGNRTQQVIWVIVYSAVSGMLDDMLRIEFSNDEVYYVPVMARVLSHGLNFASDNLDLGIVSAINNVLGSYLYDRPTTKSRCP